MRWIDNPWHVVSLDSVNREQVETEYPDDLLGLPLAKEGSGHHPQKSSLFILGRLP